MSSGHQPVTVVVATRNRLSLLRESVESVRRQRSPWRLVVVDDASTDGTSSWVTQLDDPRVELVRCEHNVERSAARNLGLERVETEYVLFLDDDDVLHPDALARLSTAASSHPEAFAAAGNRIQFDAAGHRRRMRWPFWAVCRRTWPEVLAGWVATGGQTVFRTDLLRSVGGWPAGVVVAEDQALWLTLGYTRPAVLIPHAVLDYRLHGTLRAPQNTRVVERELREAFVSRLSGRERRVGEQALIAWREIIGFYRALALRDHRAAVRHLGTAIRSAPWLLTSPLVGPGLAGNLARVSVAGALPRRRGLAFERAIYRARQLARRYPVQDGDARGQAVEFWSLPFEDVAQPDGLTQAHSGA